MYQAVGPRVQLVVGERLRAADQGDGPGVARRLGLEQPRQRRLGQGVRRGVEALQQGMPLLEAEDLQPVQRQVGRLHRRNQQPHQPRRDRFGGSLLEQVPAVLELSLDPQRLTARTQVLAQAERQVELGHVRKQRLELDP